VMATSTQSRLIGRDPPQNECDDVLARGGG
jgi:hypothetical protein